jgi:uncharacterized protein (DUF983 family)
MPDFMAQAKTRISEAMEEFIGSLKAEWQRMTCPKCGRGIMNPTYVGPGRCTQACPRHEHLHETCTLCSYYRWAWVKGDV